MARHSPIHIESDAEVLEFKAVSYGAYASNKYRVLISESGQDRDSFRPTPIINTNLMGWETEVRNKSSYVAINGYAGKDICLAFVNKSEDTGMLGFTDIRLSPYTVEVTDNTPSVLGAGTMVPIDIMATVRTPNTVDGLKAVLTTSSGYSQTLDIDQTISIGGARVSLVFDKIEVPADGLTYSVEITPRYEGAKPTVVKGEIGVPTTSYPAVAVVEEFTGTWCANCPRGTAFMNYYHDKYDGKEGRMKCVGIAIHSPNDPMLMTDRSYHDKAYAAAGAKGYPSAFFNRVVLGDPSDAQLVEALESARTNSMVSFDRVDYDGTGDITAKFSIRNSFSKNNMNLRLALVVVENDVQGTDPRYNQSNGIYGATKAAVVNTYGEELLPYFEPFLDTPSPIAFTDIKYQHVARGIYPGYEGELIVEPCTADVAVPFERSIAMPEQVAEAGNIAVIALLMDGDTGVIYSADEVEAEHFNAELSGIAAVEAGRASLRLEGSLLVVEPASDAEVAVYSLDGRALLKRDIRAGLNTIDLAALSGVVIVRVSDSEGNITTAKYIL